MKTLADYIDLYGSNGWKFTDGGFHAALAVMARDEVANPGTTDLSKFDRNFLLKLNPASDYTLSQTSSIYQLYSALPSSYPQDTVDHSQQTLDEVSAFLM